ncbi:hypothetical protein MAR_037917 [Mya arenaria]|uniref:Uncharacterized protein n=1 Tax=Mya arenaria TaxID=6604 RepID=A0ABY7FTU9_MYAAR|nr:hypothetical protein MAR_037917 [Mya arenaria]
MGTASSVQPKQGALANPRVVYTNSLGKKKKKQLQIDTPVLIDLNHGSIRYRYENETGKTPSMMTERPFEGNQKQNKGHYFYHPRLNDFSEKASADKEEPQKFLYVVKGPNIAQQKKVFYVYGRSLNAEDGKLTKPTRNLASEADPTWPQRRNPNDVYYNLTFVPHVPTDEPIPGIPNRHQIEYALSSEDTVNDLQMKIAHTIIKGNQVIGALYSGSREAEEPTLDTQMGVGENLSKQTGAGENLPQQTGGGENLSQHKFGVHLVLMER